MNMNRRTLLQSIPAAALFPQPISRLLRPINRAPCPTPATVYELRIYHVIEGKLPALLARFRDHTIAIFARHNMKSVAFWTPTDEPQNPTPSFTSSSIPAAKPPIANWKSFRVDPEWISVRDQSEAAGKTRGKNRFHLSLHYRLFPRH